VKAEIAQSGEGRYFRTAQSRRQQRGFQSRTSRLQQFQGTRHAAHVAGESVGNLHDASVAQGVNSDERNSIAGPR
jgi:hypothetical protein